jgi:cystathionine beta-synthase
MRYAENILGTIGNTPLVKLNKVTAKSMPWYLLKLRLSIQVIPLRIGMAVK